MEALFIGQTYIDVTLIADEMPKGDEKAVARDYAVSFGGNALTAGFACARLGHVPDLLTSLADDWLGRMFLDMASKYQIPVHPRKVQRSSLSFILPHEGKRAILRARDDNYLHPFPILNLGGCRGGLRSNTHELLGYIDVAIVAERLCEQMNLDERGMIDYLKGRGCRIGGITQGERGMLWYDETGEVRRLPALPVPAQAIIDTSGAGDVFHGAYVASYLSDPQQGWAKHFDFARGASAFKIQHLGNEAGLPTRADIARMHALYDTPA